MTFLVSRVGKLSPDWSECGQDGGAGCDWSAPDHGDYNGPGDTINTGELVIASSPALRGDYVLKRHHCQYPGGQ